MKRGERMAAEQQRARERRGKGSLASSAVDVDQSQRSLFTSSVGSLTSSASSGSDRGALLTKISQRGGPDRVSLQKARRASVDFPVQHPNRPIQEDQAQYHPPNSFSLALQECQNRRLRSGSLDEPGGAAMNRPPAGRGKSSILHSPNLQKGWSSERVPLHGHVSRRHVGPAALPYKWEDAEKWIRSPVNGRVSGLPPHHRRPKSKSGPLSSPFETGFAYSPPGNSPFLTGVMPAERGFCGGSVSSGGRGSCSNGGEGFSRPESLPGESELQSPCSPPSLQDKELYSAADSMAGDSSTTMVEKKDVATQMSPNGSSRSSSSKEGDLSSPSPDLSPAVMEERRSHFSKVEVRDVEVDDRVTVTRWTKKNALRGTDREKKNKKKYVDIPPDVEKSVSKIKREEARITAWENLQNAKAEAAIQKLEMKLEKERSASMEKILQKLRTAQSKAQDMRNNLASEKANQATRTFSFWSCFTCRCF